MSFGHSSAVRFDVNHHSGAPGIFWQKNNAKVEKRKFGYKSKNLRHDIRQPDNSELIAEMERKKDAEKRKFNKDEKDFISKNRGRYMPKEQVPAPGTTHISPGTVTLTQDQLAALLTSLSQLKGGDSGQDSPLKISFDAKSNKIEMERYESDDGSDGGGDSGNDDDDGGGSGNGGKSPALGIYDLLDGGVVSTKKPSNAKNEDRKKTEKKISRRGKRDPTPERSKEKNDNDRGNSPLNTARSTLDGAKKDAGVAHISPAVPLKHMTVGERKRLQWAMERAELEKEYDPWGRPGAGAPPAKSSETKADLESDIEKLRREIQDAEKKKEREEQRIIKKLLEESERKEAATKAEKSGKDNKNEKERRRREGAGGKNEEKREERRKKRDNSESRTADAGDSNEKDDENKVSDDTIYLSKKEIERRKWVEELNKQREEQRMKKQLEKERDRAGVHDQWADRFVYHKNPDQTSPRRGVKSSPREEVPLHSKTGNSSTVTFDSPPMRSSMATGAGSLNETRLDPKKADEKRAWLEELERQRDERRQEIAARKEKERQEDGMWADRYPTDRQKIQQFAQANSQPSPRNDFQTESHRVSSAPEPAVAVTGSLDVRSSQEQPTTFLRGQGVYVDPVTRKEQEEKRRMHMEYQAEIKAQIEEKERLKRQERDRKTKEDLDEERKFQMERDRVLKHEESEQRRNKDREVLQQKQLDSIKMALAEAEEKAKEEKNLRRIQHLKQRGHDVSQLKATYEAITPRIKEFDLAVIPGMGQGEASPLPSEQLFVPTHPTNAAAAPVSYRQDHASHPYKDRHPMGQSYTKEPYVENRVLTPSHMRNPSLPSNDPDSPRREFGTQTLELKDLQSILSSLPDDIQIEYKMKVEEALKEKQERKQAPSRKVHSKSAEPVKEKSAPNRTVARRETGPAARRETEKKGRVASKERSLKVNERPQWGQRKTKTIVKNSERDPFYEQRREEVEARKTKRERQLQYLQELNRERIPNISPTRARPTSPSDQAPNLGGDRGRVRNKNQMKGKQQQPKGDIRPRSNSPNILTLTHNDSRQMKATGRSSSPPLPTVKHNTVSRNDYYDREDDPYYYTNNVLKNSQTESHYQDLNVGRAAPIHDGDFVPFTRTTEILDPARAFEPLAISRENSRMERARKAYHENRRPADRGKHLNVLQDREREQNYRAQAGGNSDPILNPHLVTGHPTGRQDQILQQLSSLKQNLMQRRRELENFMEPSQQES